MQISATGTSITDQPMSTRRQAGFTLVELIAVMVIVALLVSIVALSTGTTVDDRLQVEAKRLALLMEYASENAVMSGVEVGASIEEERYRFRRLTAEGWQDYDGRHPLRPRTLPKGITLARVDEESRQKKLEKQAEKRDAEQEGESMPELLFLSTGEITPFRIELSAEGYQPRFQVDAHIDGRIQLIPPGGLAGDNPQQAQDQRG